MLGGNPRAPQLLCCSIAARTVVSGNVKHIRDCEARSGGFFRAGLRSALRQNVSLGVASSHPVFPNVAVAPGRAIRSSALPSLRLTSLPNKALVPTAQRLAPLGPRAGGAAAAAQKLGRKRTSGDEGLIQSSTAAFIAPFVLAIASFPLLTRRASSGWPVALVIGLPIVLSPYLVPADLPLMRFLAAMSAVIVGVKVIDVSLDAKLKSPPTWGGIRGLPCKPLRPRAPMPATRATSSLARRSTETDQWSTRLRYWS